MTSSFNELQEPREMKAYWALLPYYNFSSHGNRKRVSNALILVLRNDPERKTITVTKLVRRALRTVGKPIYVARKDLKLIGFSDDYAGYSIHDYLTCDDELIREAAAKYIKRTRNLEND